MVYSPEWWTGEGCVHYSFHRYEHLVFCWGFERWYGGSWGLLWLSIVDIGCRVVKCGECRGGDIYSVFHEQGYP